MHNLIEFPNNSVRIIRECIGYSSTNEKLEAQIRKALAPDLTTGCSRPGLHILFFLFRV